METLESVNNRISALINEGEFKKACKAAGDYYWRNRDCKFNSIFWFQCGLAVRLSGHYESSLPIIYQQMSECDDCTDQIKGDWLRDDALDAIRQGNPNEAEKILKEVLLLHADDMNRINAVTMARGRVAYLRKDFIFSLYLHLYAEKKWLENPEITNEQWQANNRFHLLKAFVVSGSENKVKRKEVAMMIIKNDKNRIRRWRARLINCGYLGNVIDDFAHKLKFV